MTPSPQEKATEIFDRMYQVDYIMGYYPICFDTAKQCALIAVDEIINSHPQSPMTFEGSYKYWEQVKAEIEKL